MAAAAAAAAAEAAAFGGGPHNFAGDEDEMCEAEWWKRIAERVTAERAAAAAYKANIKGQQNKEFNNRGDDNSI